MTVEEARGAAMASDLTPEAAGLQMAMSEPSDAHVAEGSMGTVAPDGSTSDQGGSLEKSLSSSSLSTLSAQASEFVPQSLIRTCSAFRTCDSLAAAGVGPVRKHHCIIVRHSILFLLRITSTRVIIISQPCEFETCDVSLFQERHLSRCHLKSRGAPPVQLCLLPWRIRTLSRPRHIHKSRDSLGQ